MFLTIWISYFLLLTRLGSLIKTQIPESQLVPRGSEPLWMRSEKSGMWISKLPWVTLQYKDQYKTSQDKTLQCYSSPCFSAGLWKFPPKHLSSTCRTTSGTYQLSIIKCTFLLYETLITLELVFKLVEYLFSFLVPLILQRGIGKKIGQKPPFNWLNLIIVSLSGESLVKKFKVLHLIHIAFYLLLFMNFIFLMSSFWNCKNLEQDIFWILPFEMEY